MKSALALVLLVLSTVALSDQPTTQAPRPAPRCLELPPEVREAWHLKQTDCMHEVPVVEMCDVTPPDVAKMLKINVSHCPKGSVANP